MLFLNWKRCEEAISLDELDGICGGVEVTVVETHGLDGIHLLKEQGMPEMTVSPRTW